ncbi:MAG: hypothetical protein Kow00104_01180 [Rhodothalassiaceae bacterium]
MIDPTPNEVAAMRHAGNMGGEYLDSLRKTDLATLTEEEWRSFIEAVVSGYVDHLADLIARDQARRAAVTEGIPFR